MKRKLILFTLTSILITGYSTGQEQGWSWNGIIYEGFHTKYKELTIQTDQLNDLAANSQTYNHLMSDFALYTQNDPSNYYHLAERTAHLSVLLKRAGDRRFEEKMKIGVHFSSHYLGSAGFRYVATARYDTLVSQSNGTQYYVDTTYERSISMENAIERFGLSWAYEWHYQPEKRFHLFCSAGATYSFSTRNTLYFGDHIARYEQQQNINSYDHGGTQEYRYENFELKTMHFGSAMGNVGVEFRWGKEKPFWQRLHSRAFLGVELAGYASPVLGNVINQQFNFGLGTAFLFADK